MLARSFMFAVLSLLISLSASAHPLAPALLEFQQQADQSYSVLWRLSALQPAARAPAPQLPAHCLTLTPPQLRLEQGGAIARQWQIDCGEQGLTGASIRIENLAASGINVILRILSQEQLPIQALLHASQTEFTVPAADTGGPAFSRFLLLGMEHLAFGPDHLLFLLGLLILVRGLRPLLITLTAFTLGHSITLSLAALDLVRVNEPLMELGIAISLVVVALEILRNQPSWLGRRPALMAGGFGLLHGLGFAGALHQVGLPQTEVVSALFGFNLGIELAQILIAASAVAIGWGLRKSGQLQPAKAWPVLHIVPAYLIGTMAILWCIERIGRLNITI